MHISVQIYSTRDVLFLRCKISSPLLPNGEEILHRRNEIVNIDKNTISRITKPRNTCATINISGDTDLNDYLEILEVLSRYILSRKRAQVKDKNK